MAKSPKNAAKNRTAKAARKPVTIDLDAKDVTKSTKADTAPVDNKKPTARRSVPKAETKQTTPRPAADEKTSGNAKETAGKKTPDPSPAGQAPKTRATQSSGSNRPASGSPASDSMGRIAAGITGGIIALVGAMALQWSGLVGGTGDAGAYASLEKLEQTSAELNARIDGLNGRIETGTEAGLAALRSDLDARIADLQASVSDANGGSNPSANAASADELEQLKAGIETSTTSIRERLKVLEQQLAGLDTLPATQTNGQSDATAGIAQLRDTIAALDTRLAGINAQVTETTAGLAETRKTLDETKAAGEARSASLETLKARLDEGPTQKAAQAIAAAALKSDIDRGVAFDETLAAFKSITNGGDDLDALEPFASGGVPTATKLTATFREKTAPAIKATFGEDVGSSLSDQLLAGARSLVEVESVEPETGSPAAIVSGIYKALETGDLALAAQLWETLPESARNVSKDWHANLQARLTADTLIGKTIRNYLMSDSG